VRIPAKDPKHGGRNISGLIYGKKNFKKPGEKKRGPKPNWYKAKCEAYLYDGNLFNFFARVAKGDPVDRFVTMSGRVVKIPSSVRNRMLAITELRDTAFGKPGSTMDVTSGGKPLPALPDIIDEARKRANS
jgi:hypothetical protein